MKRWLALGLVGLAVAWGPYLYAELVREPARASGRASRVAAIAPGGQDEVDSPEAREGPKAVGTEHKSGDQPAEPALGPAQPLAAAVVEPPPAVAEQGEDVDEDADEDPFAELPAERVPAFRRALESEPRDGFWASDEEPRLAQLFASAGVARASLDELVCRKSVCRVVFVPDELAAEAATKLVAALHERFADSLALDTRHDEARARAALYLLRKGYSLER